MYVNKIKLSEVININIETELFNDFAYSFYHNHNFETHDKAMWDTVKYKCGPYVKHFAKTLYI